MIKAYKKDVLISLLIISMIVVWRILPHTANFSPVLALSIFSGLFFSDKRFAFISPLIAMLISDLVIGLHVSMLPVYLTIYLTVFAALKIKNSFSIKYSIVVVLSSSVLFYLLTNLYFWMFSGMYPLTFSGLTDCYVRAIPFFRTALMGDAVFSAIGLSVYRLTMNLNPSVSKS